MPNRAAKNDLVTPEQVERVFQATDQFFIVRDAVIVPLSAGAEGAVTVIPDGKMIVRPPVDFEPWIAQLPAQLASMNLAKVPRVKSGW